MSEVKKKYLTIGQLKEGQYGPYIELDPAILKELMSALKDFGEANLKGLEKSQIWAKVKAKEIPKLNLNFFEPNENLPESVRAYVKKNVALKIS